jgi:hypothetical protein
MLNKLFLLWNHYLTDFFLTFKEKKTNNFFLSTKKTNRKMIALVIQYFLYINITYKLITTVIWLSIFFSWNHVFEGHKANNILSHILFLLTLLLFTSLDIIFSFHCIQFFRLWFCFALFHAIIYSHFESLSPEK